MSVTSEFALKLLFPDVTRTFVRFDFGDRIDFNPDHCSALKLGRVVTPYE